MLFNSFEFILIFLPLTTLIYFFVLRKFNIEAGLSVLVIASLIFYGYWNPSYLILIVTSIMGNYYLGRRLSNPATRSKAVFVSGISINLLVLAYFKYADFFLGSLFSITGESWNTLNILLPLAISFFTFQQISFLVDAWRGETKEYKFIHYCLFVTFFPQLIAGPIVHHKEMLPQFLKKESLHPKLSNIAIGISIFAIGFFKKTVIADYLSPYVAPVFDTPGQTFDLIASWTASLAYTFQLYFDFSGYSDMAIGIAMIFGIKLPINFFSPYKSISIIEFWRRWHITLSRFLRDYLYISIGGNRGGKYMRHRNLFITMLLGGLWHGAGWTFVIWGALHGIYLIINHTWESLRRQYFPSINSFKAYNFLAWLLTFVAVVFSWVYFRAPNIETANMIVQGMLGFNGVSLPNGILSRLGSLEAVLVSLGVEANMNSGGMLVKSVAVISCAAAISLFAPNIAQLFKAYSPVLFEKKSPLLAAIKTTAIAWSPSRKSALWVSSCFIFGFLTLTQISEFLYFQF